MISKTMKDKKIILTGKIQRSQNIVGREARVNRGYNIQKRHSVQRRQKREPDARTRKSSKSKENKANKMDR